eukprot:CAMPEP_0202914464 /NCGR_PEP_ID=MMETSP1392-20130828/63156_1 /ASSEMBLY_ACC=CAM_ASM_000868 /TAXON_ID=225041 /ORGANISM="Chlamydomonas chlamydogama, Strain SAG 11-48b" /LENGTH=48 /DNA_ID= /DNA_START= /DNA_END= /DNA_ORIENTATION=
MEAESSVRPKAYVWLRPEEETLIVNFTMGGRAQQLNRPKEEALVKALA